MLLVACAERRTSDPVPLPGPAWNPPNFLVVLLDDVGVEKIDAYGLAEAPPTPTLDALASRGVRFDRAWAMPVCSPTRAAVLTGRYPRRSGIGRALDVTGNPWVLPLSEPTIAHMLREQGGYSTAAVGKWHVGSAADPTSGFDHAVHHGFDTWAGSMGNLESGNTLNDGEPRGYYHWEKITSGSPAFRDVYATTDTADDAIDELLTLPEPWLLYVGLNAVHQPLDPPPRHIQPYGDLAGTSSRERYDGILAAADTELGRVLAALSPALEARTTVVVMGDNGSLHDSIPEPFDQDRHKGTMHDGGVRVPLLVAGAGVEQPGRSSDVLVHAVDLAPTLLELAGLRPEPSLDGRSAAAALADPADSGARDLLVSEFFSPNGPPPWTREDITVRDHDHKLIVLRDGTERFFAYGGAVDEGEDLLLSGAPLTAAQEDARTALHEAIAAYRDEVVYSGP